MITSPISLQSPIAVSDLPPVITAELGPMGSKAPEGIAVKFRTVAYDGGLINSTIYLSRYGRAVVIDLTGIEFQKSMTVNMDHRANQRVGHLTRHINNGKSLELEGLVSADTHYAKEVVSLSQNGFPWSGVLEVEPIRVEELPPNRSAVVNGRSVTGPAIIFRRSRLVGFSFVASHGSSEATPVEVMASLETYRKASLEGVVTEKVKRLETIIFENQHKFAGPQVFEIKAKAIDELVTLKRLATAEGWTPKIIDEEADKVVTKYREEIATAFV